MNIKDFLTNVNIYSDVQIHYMNDMTFEKVVVYDGAASGAIDAINDGYWHFNIDSIYVIGDKLYINIY